MKVLFTLLFLADKNYDESANEVNPALGLHFTELICAAHPTFRSKGPARVQQEFDKSWTTNVRFVNKSYTRYEIIKNLGRCQSVLQLRQEILHSRS